MASSALQPGYNGKTFWGFSSVGRESGEGLSEVKMTGVS